MIDQCPDLPDIRLSRTSFPSTIVLLESPPPANTFGPMKNNSTNGQMTAAPRSAAPDSPALVETINRMRKKTPAESLGLPAGSGLMKPFLQAGAVTLVLLALLTVIPHFVDPPKNAEAKGATLPAAEKQDPQETPKEPPTKAGTEPVAKGPAVKAPPGKGDILDKLGENGTKTVSPKVNPLDKKDDDLLKDIK